MNQNLVKTYQQNAVLTASPGKLIELLWQGMMRFLKLAEEGFKESNFIRKNEIIHNNIMKAQAIIVELQAALKTDPETEFSVTMHRLYDFLSYKLQEANNKKDKNILLETMPIIENLSNAWTEMLQNDKQSTPTAEA